ncbi:MAG: formyltransferase family protein [Candidatus Sulfotelmatobacter sp.]
MRIVVLCSSIYSETACAVAVRLADLGYAPVGALSLSTLNRDTLLRKLSQWGVRQLAQYARNKLAPGKHKHSRLQNPYLQPWLERRDNVFLNLRNIAKSYDFPIRILANQNSADAISRLKLWAPDLVVFTGGNILRKDILALPRLGVLNLHLGLLPQVRGMSSPEWSLLSGVPVGITIHRMDQGIDTGPILQKYEYPDLALCQSLADLRCRLIAFGVDELGDVIAALDRGTIISTPQSELNRSHNSDNQYFVMHEWLQARAATFLASHHEPAAAETVHG